MTDPQYARIGDWSVTLVEQDDVALRWRAEADNLADHTWAAGLDGHDALRNLARLLGHVPQNFIEEFEQWQSTKKPT